MLVKRRTREATSTGRLSQFAASVAAKPLDRRSFLRASGLTVGGLAAAATLGAGMTRRVEAAGFTDMSQPIELRKNVCTHCSVGCSVVAEVQNGVWVGQEPAFDSPINRGTHCAKGASVRELVHGDRRLKYPMKKVGGEWQRLSWDEALNEIAEKMTAIRDTSGADSVYFLGSAKFSNEGSYLFRKLAAFWGTNNVDHQARICHSTTVAGVANTWGYGAMTNSYNDIRNAKTIVFMGSNAAEAHPVSLQHILEGKETQRANVVVLDPRFTRTAAHATEYVRIRPGTDIAVVHGMLWHIFENGWEDKEFIAQRVWGMDQVREVVKNYTPDVVEEISGVDGDTLKRVAEKFAKDRPSTFIWCMGGTQHTVGTANVRAYNLLLLATGNVGGEGNGANIFRGHCNVQGATDFGLDVANLPCYYGLGAGAWKHWARVWDVPYEYFVNRFDAVPAKGGRDARTPEQNMNVPGITSTRWFDAVTIDSEEVDQRDNIKAMMVFGHGGNTVPRMQDAQRGMNDLDLLVVADPHPTTFAALHSRTDNTYLLPICTQFECSGSRTASNRSVQWGEKVVDPIFESDNDYAVIYALSERLGFADEMFKNFEMVQGKFGMEPTPESILREINRGGWSTGYTGQSPERLKAHMANQRHFDLVTLRAKADAPEEIKGDFYGLPWPCWGTPELRHPGTHILYNPGLPPMEGGSAFRPRFGLERDGETLLAEGSWPVGSEIEDGYPQFTYALLQQLGWDGDLTPEELANIAAIGGNDPEAMGNVSWSLDTSGGIQRVALMHGCVPFGNGKARAVAWNLPDPIPVHREPIYSARPDLVAQYPTNDDRRQHRMPNIGKVVQNDVVERNVFGDFPLILTSGRLVEYEGGGEETRSNPWLAELKQDMFVEINPADAEARGVVEGGWVWVTGPEGGSKARMKALVTERVAPGVAFMPFHFAGWFQGEDQRGNYPEGTDPIVLGESVNVITTYGYDPVTGMHEGKVTLCQIAAA
ncbi:MAG: membrane-bound NAD-dependent formate dehydrogenase alpha subunit FdoG [Roseibaca calidilacus]|uniref:Formate dehydrogenase major subunit n=1 Tax=Roseibaca calidilacus TaxID=1666912 RepID=A0A0N8K7V8_9RHOB|nr:formate dehydrogenase subunit alpha [Roseibaca calidilacus]KPP92817.1 MAG: membrane-bound NAD-dependent formate dehydrogenase alpha subunit FdoG [Roseibaca calidilacus]CUX80111.1 formate dehydrogenase major subunit [Roseibaca calidilacus]